MKYINISELNKPNMYVLLNRMILTDYSIICDSIDDLINFAEVYKPSPVYHKIDKWIGDKIDKCVMSNIDGYRGLYRELVVDNIHFKNLLSLQTYNTIYSNVKSNITITVDELYNDSIVNKLEGNYLNYTNVTVAIKNIDDINFILDKFHIIIEEIQPSSISSEIFTTYELFNAMVDYMENIKLDDITIWYRFFETYANNYHIVAATTMFERRCHGNPYATKAYLMLKLNYPYLNGNTDV